MDLKGAEVRDFYRITNKMTGNEDNIGMIKIPHYQRPYKWGEEMISQLIDDWQSECATEEGDSEYFAGSIVTVLDESDNGTMHQLVDGQQRFTTIFIINFLLFLILRVLLREAISAKKQFYIQQLFNDLEKSMSYLANEKFNSILEHEKLESAFAGDENDEDKIKDICNEYCETVFLPSQSESNEGYDDSYKDKLKSYMEQYELKLSYDRNSYNESIKEALSSLVVTFDSQHPLDLHISDEYEKGSIEETYINAAKVIFNKFMDIAVENNGEDNFRSALMLKDKMSYFLSSVKLCVIQTGNQDDAYTLFEVLNDRSLALDDLDLIKNQFYKNFCSSKQERNLSDEELDGYIEKLEEQWGDKIFINNSDKNKKLIAYLATSYITGSTAIGLKSNDVFRKEIKKYLENKKYGAEDIQRDFNIFEAVKIFIDSFSITANKRKNKALEAEFSKKTDLYKTVHLLLALGLEGVLAGVTNFIFQYIKTRTDNQNFSPEKVKIFLDELVTNKGAHEIIHEQAKTIWRLVLLSKDFNKPKELANRLIENNCFANSGLVQQEPQANDMQKSCLNEWLNRWQYGDPDIKVRVLFSRLLQLNLNSDGELMLSSTFHQSITPEDIQKLHLDHMEPSNPDKNNKKAYYKADNSERSDDINALGNMFPLPGDLNISKSNAPLVNAFEYLNEAGLGEHWLTKKTKNIFDENHEEIAGNKVPKQEFFFKRKQYLIDKFNEAIQM